MFTFLHAADIHLDSPLVKLEQYDGAPVEALRGAARKAFENLVALAIDESVNFVLISGDLYDGDWRDYNTGLFLNSQISKLGEADIPVFIIAGNHDAASKMTKTLRLVSNVHFFSPDKPDTVYLKDIGAVIHGQSFPTPAVRKNLSSAYPNAVPGYFNIGMLHTCVTGREGHDPYAPCTIDDLRVKGYDYWALGHIHQREILCESPFILFPGNIQGRHIRETGPKGCMLVQVDDENHVQLDFRSLDLIRWIKAEIDAANTVDGYDVVEKTYKYLEDCLEENEGLPLAARIEIKGNSSAHQALSANPERWTQEMRSAAMELGTERIWIEKIKVHTQSPLNDDFGDIAEGPLGEILQLLEDVRSDPEQLKSLGESLNPLWRKLPRELKEGSDTISPKDSQWLTSMLDQVWAILSRRLISKGGA